MINPIPFYKEQLSKFTEKSNELRKRLFLLSSLRLAIFALTALAVYYTFTNWQLALVIAAVGIVIFLYVLSTYTNLKQEQHLVKALLTLNNEELKIAKREFHHRPDGKQFQNPQHFFSLDIDLFGRGSFFQFINRTVITEGTQQLANALTANNISNIIKRQDAIKELASKPEWRQHYTAAGSLIHLETTTKSITKWLKTYSPFIPKAFKWLPLVFTIVSVALFTLSVLKILDISLLGYWLVTGLGVTGAYVKRINQLALYVDKARGTFKHYATLLNAIENETFTSVLLSEKQQQIQSDTVKASVLFKQFSKHLDALDNRNNVISAIFGNGLFLWDINQAYKIEQWIAENANKVNDWFEVVAFFDAYNSLGNYAFNHQDYVYPKLNNNQKTIEAKQLGHPLLETKKCVKSDVLINEKEFFIVTGANMAGKSTFLRTISLHIIMANVGLPVCAASSSYSPIKLITSMRTTDSLTDDSSYFFSELTRLKFIVDEIQNDAYFIILDEILKGTNSTDKAIGSRKFVEKLVKSEATGIIATHDLSLCEAEHELQQIKNYYFDAEIINDELFFDYTLKKGVCQNMNASFLLKKMEIV